MSPLSAKPVLTPCPSAEKVGKALEAATTTKEYSNAVLEKISGGNERFTGFYTGKSNISFSALELLPPKNVRPVTHCTYTLTGKPDDVVFRLLILQKSE
jgi:hypothetical protein